MIREDLKNHVYFLSEIIGERNIFQYANLVRASEYIQQQFSALYPIDLQLFNYKNKKLVNIIAKKHAESNNDLIIVGAHYDTHRGSPGANDNGTGVAVLLEIAKLLSRENLDFPIYFAAFSNEENKVVRTKEMGSYHYASHLHQVNTKIKGMFSLETMGCFSNEKGSQFYSFLFPQWKYTNIGNFMAFISNFKSKHLLKELYNFFIVENTLPIKTLVGPTFLRGFNSSDQWAFWQHGYPALMITDTAPFRYKYYHKAEDTYEKLDYVQMELFVETFVKFLKHFATKNV